MNRMIAIAGAALLLASCDRKEEGPPPPKNTELTGMPLDPKDQNAEVTRRLTVQGTWKGSGQASGKGGWIVLEVAGTSEYTIDLKAEEAGKEVILASGRGRLEWTANNLLRGRGEADRDITEYSDWTAGFPAEGIMRIRTTKGDTELKRVR